MRGKNDNHFQLNTQLALLHRDNADYDWLIFGSGRYCRPDVASDPCSQASAKEDIGWAIGHISTLTLARC